MRSCPKRLETEALSFLIIMFQRNGFRVLQKDTPKLEEIHVSSQKDRGRIHKKGRSRAYCLEQTVNCPRNMELSQASWGHPRDTALCCWKPCWNLTLLVQRVGQKLYMPRLLQITFSSESDGHRPLKAAHQDLFGV